MGSFASKLSFPNPAKLHEGNAPTSSDAKRQRSISSRQGSEVWGLFVVVVDWYKNMQVQYFTSISDLEAAYNQVKHEVAHAATGPVEDWLEEEELSQMNPRPVAVLVLFDERDMAGGVDEYFDSLIPIEYDPTEDELYSLMSL